jgi:SAM-dependent methyltransferase
MKKITRKHLRPFLERYARSTQVLEIGGGKVETNHSYEDLFPNRFTIDIDPARKPDVVGDVHALPFADNSYDFILCTEVLEHLHAPHVAISEMDRVLRSGGTLVLTTRFVFPIHDAPHDYYRYTKYGLQYLFRDWDIIELKEETETLSAIGALLQRVGFQTDVRGGKCTKLFLYGLAFLLDKSNALIKNQYGDIRKSAKEHIIMTTGYYVAAKKR